MIESTVIALSLSERRGIKKHNVPSAKLIAGFGMEGDAHGGDWHRQISLLGIESIDMMRSRGAAVNPGDFAENITVKGATLYELPIGTKLTIGEAVLEVTQIGKECHTNCEIFYQVGSCIMPTQGIFAKVLKSGAVQPGDKMIIHVDK